MNTINIRTPRFQGGYDGTLSYSRVQRRVFSYSDSLDSTILARNGGHHFGTGKRIHSRRFVALPFLIRFRVEAHFIDSRRQIDLKLSVTLNALSTQPLVEIPTGNFQYLECLERQVPGQSLGAARGTPID